ncbi:penicillin-binding transpeptidase domain-containing protein [Phreatobacter sp.]|uniref:penicillin-binding transpeptidase domain-containing protein n=1 Tax=Phreatobacter sp. TaxID=1966341 RepID=UPI003F6F9B48
MTRSLLLPSRRDALILAAALPLATPAIATGAADLKQPFRAEGVTGTFALVASDGGAPVLVDPARARRRYVPASTFKIPNSLIAFEAGAVADADAIVPYGGTPSRNPAWNRDMSLREAMPISNVPAFQQVARRVGLPAYRDWLARLDYGNRDPGTVVDRFWLEGPLTISALEEAGFNLRLARSGLPASERAQALTRDIVRLEADGGATLHGKTGWFVKRGQTSIGWWTGWVERGSRIHAFTLNIDMPQMAMAPKRLAVGRAILKTLGVYG